MSISQSDSIEYDKPWFDGNKYIDLQTHAIRERIAQFPGKLYIEVGGKFLYDAHASRVLPGFDPASKERIFERIDDDMSIIFCLNARDISHNRQLGSQGKDYMNMARSMIDDIIEKLDIRPHIVINLVDDDNRDIVDQTKRNLESTGFVVSYRYVIDWYPDQIDHIVSDEWYGRDDYVNTDKNLILVTWAASNSGKMSTCLGQMYLDKQQGIDSGYAKYETFPIWNLDLEHPINLAYEAATADIEDFNCVDFHHEDYYNKVVTNYNRDVETFPLVMALATQIVDTQNHIHTYHSPTDMGINRAGFAITDDRICAEAALEEIKRRRDRYQSMVDRGEGESVWVEDCERLIQQAEQYFL